MLSDKTMFMLIFIAYLTAPVNSQLSCVTDVDCGYQCCSKYGFCGDGPDYCTPGKTNQFSHGICLIDFFLALNLGSF